MVWSPANDTESAMAEALWRGDSVAYFQALAGATLYLPVPADAQPPGDVRVSGEGQASGETEASGEPGPRRLVTVRSSEHTYLVAFTSPESLARRLLDAPFHETSYLELRAKWPDPRWLLAVDPDLPIQGFVSIDIVAEVAAGRLRLPAVPVDAEARAAEPVATEPGAAGPGDAGSGDAGSGDAGPATGGAVPADETERAILAAMRSSDVDGVIRALLAAEVHLPPAAGRTISVFTSAQRLAERVPPGTPGAVLPFLDVVRTWPGADWRLAVNPGSALALAFPGERVLDLMRWARQRPAGEAGPDPQPPTRGAPVVRPGELLQKTVPHRQVESYLHGHWSQVSGPVHRCVELRDLRTPAQLHAATGGAAGAFRAEDPWVHVIRWPADCPALYLPVPGGGPVTTLRAHAVALPHGARLHRLDRDTGPTWLASFDADTRQWLPAPGTGTSDRAPAS